MTIAIIAILSVVGALASGFFIGLYVGSHKERPEFMVTEDMWNGLSTHTDQFNKNVDTEIGKLQHRVDCLFKTADATKEDTKAAVEHMGTLLSVTEVLSEEVDGLKESVTGLDEYTEALAESMNAIVESLDTTTEQTEVLAQGFNATAANITKLQEAQIITRDLLDTTINSLEWEDDEIPSSVPTHAAPNVSSTPNPLLTAFVPVEDSERGHTMTGTEKASDGFYDETPDVPVRGPNDPLITDLRPTPFEEAPPIPGADNLYDLSGVDGVEEWGSSSSDPVARARSRRARAFGG